jgi:DNA-binding MarR family transcriptional regulator
MESLSASMRQSMREFNKENGDAELFNITITQLHYLHAIELLQGPTYRQLAEKFNVQKPTVTEIVNRLIKRRLVYKQQCREDLRSSHLFLDEHGHRLLELERQGYRHFARKMTTMLTVHEKQSLTELLKKVADELRY